MWQWVFAILLVAIIVLLWKILKELREIWDNTKGIDDVDKQIFKCAGEIILAIKDKKTK